MKTKFFGSSVDNNFRSFLLMGAALLGAAGAAEAQSAPAAADDSGTEVIVTATKRETKLQDTPIAIAVLGADMIKASSATSLLDLAGITPTLRVSTFESRQTALTVGIRGIVPGDANQPAREQGVGVYLDGVYLGRQQGLNASMLDIERIEVLRGPQGTLFGRNTEGGALSMVTRKPTGEFGVRSSVGLSNFNGYNFDAHIDLPKIADVALKFDAARQYRDAFVKNPLDGQEGWGLVDRYGYRASALWEPVATFNAIYSYDYGYSESTPLISQLVSYNPLNLPVSSAFPRPSGTISPLPPGVQVRKGRIKVADIGVPQQPSVDEISGHTLRLNWELTPNLDLRSITAYREVSVQQYDNAGGAIRPPVFQPNAPVGNAALNFSRYSLSDMDQLQRSQEFQLVGNAFDNRLDYVIGAYYFNEKAQEEAATPASLTWVGSTGAYVVRDPKTAGIPRGFRSIDRGSFAKAESKGLFVHTTYKPPILDDKLSVTLGGRYTDDHKNGTLYRVSNTARNFTFTLNETRFDPVVTLAYDVKPDVNVYATYSTGYRAGGANSRSLNFRPFQSEEVENREVGLKAVWFDRLTTNVALFDMIRSNSQIEFTLVAPDPTTGNIRNTVETVNAPGDTKLRGAEIETKLDITDNLRLSLAYNYIDTAVPNARNPFPVSAACPTCGTVQPVYVIYTPQNSATAALDYVYPLDNANIRFHIDAAYAQGTQSFEQFAQTTDDSFVVNARLSLADWKVRDGATASLSIWSRNLLDNDFIYRRSAENRSGSNAIGDYANYNEPRTFGVELGYKF
ncbi:MAG: TonB-dependent receptor [Alphaproteobacteria bacterium]|nr:TonB-dependent receptor [Alphaproteobacteria bacterium]